MFRPYQLTHKVELPLLFVDEKAEFLREFKDQLTRLGYEINVERLGKEDKYVMFTFDGLEITTARKGQAVISLTAKEYNVKGHSDIDLREIGFNEQAMPDLSATLLAYLNSERETHERIAKEGSPKSNRDYHAKLLKEVDKSIKILSQSTKQSEITS